MTPEGKVKQKIDALLKLYGAYYLKPVQNGMGAAALDYHGVHRGYGFVIEAKAPGEHMTDRQVRTALAARAGGAAVFCVDSTDPDEAATDMYELRWWLDQPFDGKAGSNWIHECDLYRQRTST